MDQVFGPDAFFIGDISIGVKDAAVVFEEFFGDLLASRHLEVKHHAFARRAVLPEISFMILAFFVGRLHVYVGFISTPRTKTSPWGPRLSLNIISGKQIALHRADDRDQQFAHTQMYGLVQQTPQSETTPFYPRSPYAVAKLYAYWITVNYRESYGMFACNGILFNHESPMRGETFVTRKITRGLARIKLGLQNKLYLGNLDSKRDWGHARDYIEMQWMMLQQPAPRDYVIATGMQYSVREFATLAAEHLGMQLRWEGFGVDERGYDQRGREVVSVDPRYFRPAEVETLLGDATRARVDLGWQPKTSFHALVEEMVVEDLKSAEKDALMMHHGYSAYNVQES